MNKIIKNETMFAGKKLMLETGELANQANLAVKATYGDTVVLATVVAGKAAPEIDFFPLTVSYEEKLYASGIIKSSRFVKRDGKPTDDAVITRRLIDHAIRPLFPKGYMDEVQIILTVLSLDEDADPEFLSLIATSAALHASNIPWNGPMVSTKVGFINEDYVLNPSKKTINEHSELDMTVSFVGEDKKFLATETEAGNLAETMILGAIEFARNNIDNLYALIIEFAKNVNPQNIKYEYESKNLDDETLKVLGESIGERANELLVLEDKNDLSTKKAELLAELYEKYEGVYKKTDMETALAKNMKSAFVQKVMVDKQRVDGRAFDEIRDISAQIGVLPRTHGSGLFNRGATQVLTVTTLGSPALEQLIQDMYGERSKRYIHYYNFPPFSTGETGRLGGAKPREIGHGMLAEKALRPVIPTQEEFPYTILLMSETLASDGSSSMAATCASTLALMDAGVPIKAMVAGIAIGLVTNEDQTQYEILTDIRGIEDGFGYMDFKMTGTKTGVTAIQVDLKLPGIPMELLPKIIEQSKKARVQILEVMEKTIAEPKKELSKYAPKIATLKIDPAKIGMVIGSGGKTIREIQTKSGAELNIDEEGNVFISAYDPIALQKAIDIVTGMLKDPEIGEIYEGKIEEIVDFGAFVEILPGKTGLLHVSEIAHGFVKNVRDYLKVGDIVKVKVIEKNGDGKISLSKKALEPNPYPNEETDNRQKGGKRFESNNRDNRRFTKRR